MQKKRPISAYVFSFIIAATAGIISYFSLYHLKTYTGNSTYLLNQIIGSDLITLYIGLPLLVVTSLLALHKSGRAYLAWLGTLSYFLYTYLWYSCGIAYNKFYLFYIAIFVLSLYALIRGLIALDAEVFSLRFSAKTPIRSAAFFLLCGGILLGYYWLYPMLPAITAGKRPDFLRLYGTTATINQVMNLGIISPLAVITSLWIWKRKPWGYITAGILLLFGLFVGLTFLVSQWVVYHHGHRIGWNQTMIFGGITLINFVLWIVFLKNLREETIQDYHSRVSSQY